MEQESHDQQALAAVQETAEIDAIPKTSPHAIQQTKQQIALLQGMVKDLLKREVDYGRIPGTPSDSLWDPGASTIISAFNCYPGQRRILSLRDDTERISVMVEVPIISRITGRVMATGVGAASTMETKYKYRWLSREEALTLGFDEESLKTLKTKADKQTGEPQYRIPNPEHGELLNTIFKMAAKRAEVDAAQSLPGVSSVLRQLFTGKLGKAEGAKIAAKQAEGPLWTRFYGEIQRLGLTPAQAHELLGVNSIKDDWVGQGKTLKEAVDVLRQKVMAENRTEGEEVPEPAEVPPQSEQPKPKRDPSTIKSLTELYKASNEDFKMQPKDVVSELGYSSQTDITETPAQCYMRIWAAKKGVQ